MSVYNELKSVLRTEGWIEQRDGEGYMNGYVGTNFGKDGEIISIGYNTLADDEEWNELFED
jgi:hypothetical protein